MPEDCDQEQLRLLPEAKGTDYYARLRNLGMQIHPVKWSGTRLERERILPQPIFFQPISSAR